MIYILGKSLESAWRLLEVDKEGRSYQKRFHSQIMDELDTKPMKTKIKKLPNIIHVGIISLHLYTVTF